MCFKLPVKWEDKFQVGLWCDLDGLDERNNEHEKELTGVKWLLHKYSTPPPFHNNEPDMDPDLRDSSAG